MLLGVQMKENNELKGLSGWLVLIGIGVVLSPFRLLSTTIPLFSDIYSNGVWEILTTVGSSAYNPYWAPLLISEIIFNTCIFIASIYLIYLFFTKKIIFPTVYIAIVIISLIFIPLDAVIATKIFPNEPVFDTETTKEFMRILVGGLIWIPYLLKSKRVKATFIESYNKSKDVKLIGSACLLTTLVLIFALIADKTNNISIEPQSTLTKIKNETPSLSKILTDAASQININLPMMVDSETQLDSTVGINGQFIYKYTLINYSAEELDGNILYKSMEQVLINNVCTSEEMSVFIDLNIPVKYMYYGKNGKKVTSITVESKDCPSA